MWIFWERDFRLKFANNNNALALLFCLCTLYKNLGTFSFLIQLNCSVFGLSSLTDNLRIQFLMKTTEPRFRRLNRPKTWMEMWPMLTFCRCERAGERRNSLPRLSCADMRQFFFCKKLIKSFCGVWCEAMSWASRFSHFIALFQLFSFRHIKYLVIHIEFLCDCWRGIHAHCRS